MMECWNNGILGLKNENYPDLNIGIASYFEKRLHPFKLIIPTFQYSIIPRLRASA